MPLFGDKLGQVVERNEIKIKAPKFQITCKHPIISMQSLYFACRQSIVHVFKHHPFGSLQTKLPISLPRKGNIMRLVLIKYIYLRFRGINLDDVFVVELREYIKLSSSNLHRPHHSQVVGNFDRERIARFLQNQSERTDELNPL